MVPSGKVYFSTPVCYILGSFISKLNLIEGIEYWLRMMEFLLFFWVLPTYCALNQYLFLGLSFPIIQTEFIWMQNCLSV